MSATIENGSRAPSLWGNPVVTPGTCASGGVTAGAPIVIPPRSCAVVPAMAAA